MLNSKQYVSVYLLWHFSQLLERSNLQGYIFFCYKPMQQQRSQTWLMSPIISLVGGSSPTHLKNMHVKPGSYSPSFGVKIKNMWNHHLVYQTFRKSDEFHFTPPNPAQQYLRYRLGHLFQPRCHRFGSSKGSQVKSTEPRKKPSYFPLHWLVNTDPYIGLL